MSDIYNETKQLLAHLGEALRRADTQHTLASARRYVLRDTDEQRLNDAGIVLNDELRALYGWELADVEGSLAPGVALWPHQFVIETHKSMSGPVDTWLILGTFLLLEELFAYDMLSSQVCVQYPEESFGTAIGTIREVARRAIERLQNGTYFILPTEFGLSISDLAPPEIWMEPGFTAEPDSKFKRISMYTDDA